MSILNQEIFEQPAVIQGLIAEEGAHIEQLASDFHEARQRGAFSYILIAARGTSDNAARYAQYLFGAYNHLPVALATPSLFTLYKEPPDLRGALVVGISQSGQSPDIVEVIREARQQGCLSLAICNDPASPLAATAEYQINLRAGREKAVAATKTYTASLAALALLSASLSGDAQRLQLVRRLPKWMEAALQPYQPAIRRAERYRYMSHCVVIGRGFNYATAFEIALKIKELTRVITEPYSSADFRHGPIAMVRDGFPVMVIIPKSGAASDDVRSLVLDLKRRGAELLIISDDEELLSLAQLPLPVPGGVPEWLTPLVTVLPGQLFGLALAQAKMLNPDSPEGITKVTETL